MAGPAWGSWAGEAHVHHEAWEVRALADSWGSSPGWVSPESNGDGEEACPPRCLPTARLSVLLSLSLLRAWIDLTEKPQEPKPMGSWV